jgi:hypothetical protein
MKTVENPLPISHYAARGKTLLWLVALFIFLGATIYFVSHDKIFVLIGGVFALVAGYLLIRQREFATLLFVFILYTNLAVLAIRYHGVPQMLAATYFLLPALPLAYYIFQQRQRLIFDQPLGLMAIYLLVLLAASISARDMELAWSEILNYLLEGFLLYFLMVNVIRTPSILKRVIWVLLLAGSVLGTVSLVQELTHTYDNNYGGLSLRREDLDIDAVDFNAYSGARSAGGPFGDENRYGQIMLVILPLALYLFFVETRPRAKLLAAGAAALILGGIVLTFSRGTFVTLAGVAALMLLLKFIRAKKILLASVGLLVLISVALPEYYDQVDTVTSLTNLFSTDAEETRSLDGSFRGRYAQMVAAFTVFLEHPIAGVGPGHFSTYYARKYGNEVGVKYLRSNRRAHNLYIEMIANLGLIGITSFMAIALFMIYRLWQARRRFLATRPDLAQLAVALILSICAYLGSAMFLHLSFQRYYWFTLALAGAALQIFAAESRSGLFAASATEQAPKPRTLESPELKA